MACIKCREHVLVGKNAKYINKTNHLPDRRINSFLPLNQNSDKYYPTELIFAMCHLLKLAVRSVTDETDKQMTKM